MNVYQTDIRITATVYVRAESKARAEALVAALHGDCIHVAANAESEVAISGLPYDHAELPEVSLSPVMTLWAPQGKMEIALDNANRTGAAA